MTSSFVHLHAHSEYSMLDGASRVGDMFEAAAAAGMPACAITDHGVMYGALEFYKTGSKSGVKPILGMEGYLFSPGHRSEKPPQRENGDKTFHLTLLAMNDQGYKNLIKLSSKAWLEGFHYFPRTDHEILAEYSEGLICLSGCLSAEIPKLIVAGDLVGARRKVAQYREVFGDRFYLELQDHGIAVQAPLNDELVKIGTEMGIPWVATNDSHYTHKHQAAAHEVLLCINTGSELSDPNRFKFDSDEFYIKTPEEMAAKFARWPGACENTLDVAERCNVSLSLNNIILPHYEVPDGKTSEQHLRDLVYKGLEERYPEVTPEVKKRAEFELSVINDMKFPDYFLVVQDFVNWAKRNGIRVGPGRGSAAGSIVSYAIGITELDPLRYGLIFERFLNPGRKQMPDIDIDFDERKRGEVIRYVAEKYGEDHVAQIITYGTIKGKQAIKDAARVLGYPYADGDRLCKMYPPLVMGRDGGLQSALETSPELKGAYEEGGAAKEIIETALQVENLKRSAGIHAAGVVIGRDPLVEHLPLKRGDHGEIVTQYDLKGVEELGLLKMDFLGLRNLAVIDLTVEYVKANQGLDIDVDNLDLTDPKVYEMLQRGDSDGVFQLESDGMRRLLAQLRPDRFEQIDALIALYRPGPMAEIPKYIAGKNDPSSIVYDHPAFEDFTKETYGVLLYQEQILMLLQKIAGYSAADADLVRRAIGKKDRAKMAAEEPRFIEGCKKSGLTEKDARRVWGLIQPFADYSFNRAHSACYAYVAFQTAWLKAHYPVEYMAALLTSVKDNKDSKPFYLHMARKMGIPVLLPDVNSSDRDFTPVEESIRFGLSAIRGVGESVVAKIVEARNAKGAFTSFYDFCRKVDYTCLNKKTLESLIKAGAFESLGHTRKGLLDAFESICGEVVAQRKQEEAGQFSLFGGGGGNDGSVPSHAEAPIAIDEHPKEIVLAHEKEALGLYVSDHPLLGIEGLLARMCDAPLSALRNKQPGEMITVGGLVASLNKRLTRRGDIMLLIDLEDLSGATLEVVVFARTYQQYAPLLRADAILVIKGRIDRDARDDSVKLMATEVHEPKLGDTQPLVIKLPVEACTRNAVDGLKDVLAGHPGHTPVFVRLDRGEKATVLRLASEFSVDTSNGLHAEIKAMFGPEALTG
ncbi:MAG TPA: DNA polymerase III subunit alpha [Actinomycetota bacterium]|nr:DNA polymerase III subunit alpha [Actinomycetota bacterium]